MATFYANPNDENEPWIEKAAIDGLSFRVWHVMFFCFSGFVVSVILIGCCVKIRVPRTKQEIEADYRRKKLADKFKERLKMIQNQEMDEIDLERALDIIREDYKEESRSIELNPGYSDFNVGFENVSENLKGEPQVKMN
ncbi:transmembrane inner ear expressed protein isoform X2 [Onthophagus taurus]|uniref:transmembrane inner ear expressed protein isoform X2 n=1 Tax=Onthophagus taurus TaxID=166361 RepID=UPI000C2089B1|nr:transmembrane inner ear expressed protein isoform X2 [Onthophagus taurus]